MENAVNIGNLFAFSIEPVVVTEGGVIGHMNPAAISLFGKDYLYKPLCTLIPEHITAIDLNEFVASAYIEDTVMTITCSTLPPCKLYTFQLPTVKEDETIIHSVSSTMRELTGGIKTNTDLLKLYALQSSDPSLREYTAILNHYTSKLKRLVNNYTVFSDIKESKQLYKPTMCSVNEILDELSREVTDVTITHNCRVCFHPSEDVYTALDQDLIVQMLMNLISNSLNHMPNGGVIDLSTSTMNNLVLFRVEDNGTGIPAEIMKNIFKAYTLPMNFGENTLGTGLGMSVADSIAKLHGGSMIVESREGKGTRITVSIPRVTDGSLNSPKPKYDVPLRCSLLTDLSTWLSWEDYLTEI